MAKQSRSAVLLAILSISAIVAGQLLGGAQAADAPAPAGVDCVVLALSDLSDCYTYVQTGSTLKVPAKGCCPALSGYLKKQPTCLCSLAKSTDLASVYGIDPARALLLPGVCRLKTASVSSCSATSPTGSAPGGAPSSEGPGVATSPTGSALGGAPSSEGPGVGSSATAPPPKNGATSSSGVSLLVLFLSFSLVVLPSF